MNSQTYYGEYTLKHWITLILKGDIKLPEYQRSFVWSEKSVLKLIESLKDGQFIPPVTIAHYQPTTGPMTNLILDGQQRLTSILLAYLGFFPNKSKFSTLDTVATDDDSNENEDGENEDITKRRIGWTYEDLPLKDTNVADALQPIREQLATDDKYCPLQIDFEQQSKEDFYENTYLGFSYIVPHSQEDKDIQKFFSQMFRNMNYLGQKLSPIESRRSLYYLNTDFVEYFDGRINNNDVLCDIKIVENMIPCKIDFVRYLAILSQYYALQRNDKVMVGYSAYSSRETFYADYVSYLVGLEQSDRPRKFDNFNFATVFPNQCWKDRFAQIRDCIAFHKPNMRLSDKGAFSSWIDADYWLFGLIYWMLFENKTINFNLELITNITDAINESKSDERYSKTPNLLHNLRERLQKSIEIYSTYAQ